MTYPTEFFDQNKTIGSSSIKHPVYTFQVNINLNSNEAIGPVTNQSFVSVLHPDLYQSSPDLGRAQKVVRHLQNTTWFATEHAAGNIEIKDNGTIVVYGSHGTYLKNTFTVGNNPLLTLISS